MSSPVTMLPTVRRAGMSTEAGGCLNKYSGVMISIIDHGKTLECYRENIYIYKIALTSEVPQGEGIRQIQ